MALPQWEDFNVGVLQVLSDGETRTIRELRADVADRAQLTDEQRSEKVPSGGSRAEDRIGWAVSYLHRVDALTRPSRGSYAITEIGRNLLKRLPTRISESDLRAIAKEGDEWWISRRSSGSTPAAEVLTQVDTALDPSEQVEVGIARIHDAVAAELLARLREQEAAFFEQAVVDLLLAMGYGGTGGRGAVTALSNDGGIDGVIDQDVLGLSQVYVQAKRYGAGNAVQRPDVQAFVGALAGKADRGVFITTSRFSQGATTYAASVPARLILIDGQRLAELMIRFGVGVQVKRTHNVVELDEDYFV